MCLLRERLCLTCEIQMKRDCNRVNCGYALVIIQKQRMHLIYLLRNC